MSFVFFCFTLYIGAQRVTDNVTPEPEIRYEVFANGRFIGLLDRGNPSAAWGNLKLNDEGHNRVFVEAVDAAGNRSRSGTNTVTGYDCEISLERGGSIPPLTMWPYPAMPTRP